jgi:hypothetical protein
VNEALLLFTCYACTRPALACPECVTTVHDDPHTGLPVDVAILDGRPVSIEPTEHARARSRKQPICDTCVRRRNQFYPDRAGIWMTAGERHRRAHL